LPLRLAKAVGLEGERYVAMRRASIRKIARSPEEKLASEAAATGAVPQAVESATEREPVGGQADDAFPHRHAHLPQAGSIAKTKRKQLGLRGSVPGWQPTTMKFLTDERLYASTDACLRYLRGLSASGASAAPTVERYHFYWHGAFSRKQAFAVKSFLATQSLDACELWLWLEGGDGYEKHAGNPFLRPLLPFLHVRPFDAVREARGTPLASLCGSVELDDPTHRSNFVRFAILYNHGGTWGDVDTLFLRDLGPLRTTLGAEEFCYRWSKHTFGNSALLRLRQGSANAAALLQRCAALSTCRPKAVLKFAATEDVGLLVLPSGFFDPLWLHHDRKERFEAAPFDRFEDFFRTFSWRHRRRREIRSYRDFFPGAFTYHWHNLWSCPETRDSYFGAFDQELDSVLHARFGIEPVSWS
jgi:hypothetical protein